MLVPVSESIFVFMGSSSVLETGESVIWICVWLVLVCGVLAIWYCHAVVLRVCVAL